MMMIQTYFFSFLVTFDLQVSMEAIFILRVLIETLNYRLYCSVGFYLKAEDLRFSLSS